jgi:putative heme-binding domain-containing protein
MKVNIFLFFAIGFAVFTQAFGYQVPMPPVPSSLPQPKQQKISKPVPLGGASKIESKSADIKKVPKSKSASNPNRKLKSFPRKKEKLNLIGGDQIVFVGDGLIEQMQKFGYLEHRLTIQNQGKALYFKNIGWSGDTPAGISRDGLGTRQAGHEPDNEGWIQLKKQIADIKPNVVIIGYGMASSLDGSTLEQFKSSYQNLVAHIKSNAGKKNPLRLVFLSPIAHEDLGGKLPNGRKHNSNLEKYREIIGGLAKEHDAWFVDLYRMLKRRPGSSVAPVTHNGIHLNEYGYWNMAAATENSIGYLSSVFRFSVLGDGSERSGGYGIKLTDIKRDQDEITLNADIAALPPVFNGKKETDAIRARTSIGRIQIQDCPDGDYTLVIDGEEAFTASSSNWIKGAFFDKGPDVDLAERIRKLIVEKNELYFHRSRPQNQAYLWGFRRHEQGNNFSEIPKFDPLIKDKESEIFALNKVQSRKYKFIIASKLKELKSSNDDVPDTKVKIVQESFEPQPLPEFNMGEGLQIQLFAQNPHLAKPIQMNFDAKGRLWVASSEVYPQILPGQMASDKIIILEDLNNDGQADKSTVFADNLLIPTGIEPGDDGVYVGQSTELLHLKDNDGDGKADESRVIAAGFGTEDTHHILHSLRWGFDGRLYFNQSIYIRTHMETPHVVHRLESGGVWRMRPETLKAEIFLRGFCNPWGHHYDEFGQSFVTDGAGGQGLSYGVPGAMYFTYARAPKLLESVSPGRYPKFCGLELVRSEHFPDDWQGDAITCDFRAHRLVRFDISEKGSSYVTQEMPDVLRSPSVTFRPIDVKMGPDGALYIADWSNPIIQHGEVDFRDKRRDHVHGRIWRLSYKGRAKVNKIDLTRLNVEGLLEKLKSPNGFQREKARRLLKERGEIKVLPMLKEWVSKQVEEQILLEGLWIYQSLDVVNKELLDQLLEAKDGRVRTAAVQVLSEWHSRITDVEGRLATRISDEHPRVRLAALRSITSKKSKSNKVVDAALSVFDNPTDNYLEYAAWLSMNDIEEPWLNMVRRGEWLADGNEKQLEFALKTVDASKASEVLGVFLKGKAIPEDGSWIEIIGRAGTIAELEQLHSQLIGGEYSQDGQSRALNSMSFASRNRNIKPNVDKSSISKFFSSDNEQVRIAALSLAGTWKGLGDAFKELVSLARAKDLPPNVRQASINAIREIGGDKALQILSLISKSPQMKTRIMSVEALALLDINQGAPVAIKLLNELKSEQEALVLWRSLLQIKNSELALVKELPEKGFSQSSAKAGLRAIREGGRNMQTLILALPRSSGLKDEDITLSKNEIIALSKLVNKSGDPIKGEMVYRKLELGCVSCHAIGGAGGKVGPDLTSIGASAPLDYLVESIYYPNRKIKEGYHSVVIETKNNQVLFGMLENQNEDEIFLRDVANQRSTVLKRNIRKQTQGNSLMPSGLIDRLAKQDQIDLFSFLSRLGKKGDFDASKGNVARVWRLRAANHRDQQFDDNRIADGGINHKRWTKVNSLVDGTLTDKMLKQGANAGRWVGVIGVYAGAEFEVAKAGKVSLMVQGGESAKLWIDGKVVDNSKHITSELSSGKHSIVLRFDPKDLPSKVKVSASTGTFLVD